MSSSSTKESSSTTKVSSSSSSKKVSSSASSMSSSTKISSSSSVKASELGSLTGDSLVKKLASIDLLDQDLLLGGVGGGETTSSMTSSSSSSKKQSSSLSSFSQSSIDKGDGAGPQTTMKSHSSSTAKAAALEQKASIVDGQLVEAETKADRLLKKAEKGEEKTMEGGQVTNKSGYNVEQTKEAKLRATKEMSKEELDAFFRQPQVTGTKPEALNYDKQSNSFEVHK